QGIDITHHHVKKDARTASKSESSSKKYNTPQLYRFLAWCTDVSFNKVLLHHLFLSKMNHAPLSLSRIMKETTNTVDLPNKIIVLVGTITDDIRLTEVPKLTIAALRFICTRSATLAPEATKRVLPSPQPASHCPPQRHITRPPAPHVPLRQCPPHICCEQRPGLERAGGEEHVERDSEEHVEHGDECVHDVYPDDGSSAACGRTASMRTSTKSSASVLGFVIVAAAVEACSSIAMARHSRR
ncbi:hypothetical protein DFH08DRAFT_708169, partial [Mycena albidolilacea]